MTCLTDYDWPGNVRELENVIRRAVAIGIDEAITPADLPESIVGAYEPAVPAPDLPAGDDTLAAYELAAISNALTKCDGHRKKAAQLLGIGEATLYRKINKYQVDL